MSLKLLQSVKALHNTAERNIPVSDAVLSIVAQSAGVRSSPGDRGLGPTTYFALQCNAVSTLTRHVADRDEELRRSWRDRGLGLR